MQREAIELIDNEIEQIKASIMMCPVVMSEIGRIYQSQLSFLQHLRAVLSGKTEQVCTIDKTDCLGYKGGKCVSIENCYGKEERLVSGKE